MPDPSAARPLGITAEDEIRFRLDALVVRDRRSTLRVFGAALIAAAVPAVLLGLWLDHRLDRIDYNIRSLELMLEEIGDEMDMLLFREGKATD